MQPQSTPNNGLVLLLAIIGGMFLLVTLGPTIVGFALSPLGLLIDVLQMRGHEGDLVMGFLLTSIVLCLIGAWVVAPILQHRQKHRHD